jgi:hypothetical protein
LQVEAAQDDPSCKATEDSGSAAAAETEPLEIRNDSQKSAHPTGEFSA